MDVGTDINNVAKSGKYMRPKTGVQMQAAYTGKVAR